MQSRRRARRTATARPAKSSSMHKKQTPRCHQQPLRNRQRNRSQRAGIGLPTNVNTVTAPASANSSHFSRSNRPNFATRAGAREKIQRQQYHRHRHRHRFAQHRAVYAATTNHHGAPDRPRCTAMKKAGQHRFTAGQPRDGFDLQRMHCEHQPDPAGKQQSLAIRPRTGQLPDQNHTSAALSACHTMLCK